MDLNTKTREQRENYELRCAELLFSNREGRWILRITVISTVKSVFTASERARQN